MVLHSFGGAILVNDLFCVDFLLLNRPIGFFVSDFEKYKESRGFTFKKPLDYMPGEIIFTTKDLITFINKTFVLKIDDFKEKRIDINSKLNEVCKDASQKIYRKVIGNSQYDSGHDAFKIQFSSGGNQPEDHPGKSNCEGRAE